MLPRVLNKSRERFSLIFLTIILTIFVVYFYHNLFQEKYKSAQWSGDRCMTELNTVKYQLNVVTEYKNKIDRLLTETQKVHDTDMDKFKDIMESCVAMKQQSLICQSQFEDLQTECLQVRKNFDKLIEENNEIKTKR